MKKFYCGVDFKQLMPYSGDTMINYETIRNKKIFDLWPVYGETFCDSGGFSAIIKNGKFTYSPYEYFNFTQRADIDYFATMDYPCEKLVLNKTGMSVKQHINLTVESALFFADCKKCVPVIQGYTIDEYLNCLDNLKDYGLIKNFMAVGTLCKRQSSLDCYEILKSIHDEIPKVKLHAFGLKINAIKICKEIIYSSDSIAWFYFKCGGIDKKIPIMKEYSQKIRLKYCEDLNE